MPRTAFSPHINKKGEHLQDIVGKKGYPLGVLVLSDDKSARQRTAWRILADDMPYASRRICFRSLLSNADAGTKRRSRLTWMVGPGGGTGR